MIARWHSDAVVGLVAHLIRNGAQEYEPVVDREGGFVTTSVLDPFENMLGLIQSPHWVERATPQQET